MPNEWRQDFEWSFGHLSTNIHRAGKRIPYQSLVTEVQEVLFWLNHLDGDTWDEAQVLALTMICIMRLVCRGIMSSKYL